jgi:hypothetical protein
LLSPHENIDDGWDCLIENKCCPSYTIIVFFSLYTYIYTQTM